MKKFLKYLGSGFLFFLMSGCCSLFGIAAYNGFVAVGSCGGWEAIWLCGVSCFLTFFVLFLIYVMGLIHLGTIEDLRSKLKEQEEDAARDYEALYKAATYDYQHKGVEK